MRSIALPSRWTFACLIGAALLSNSVFTDETVPADLRPFVELADKCEKYDQAAQAWDVIFEEDLTKPATCEVAGGGGIETLRAEKEKEKPVLVFDAAKIDRATMTFGPEIAGDFRAIVEVKIMSEHVSDLDLSFGGAMQDPGFQFGTQENSRNILTTGVAELPAGGPANGPRQPRFGAGGIELPHDNLILRRAWHRIGLEVIGDSVGAMLDGKCIGRSKLTPGFDRMKPRKLVLATVKSTLVIRALHIEQFRTDPQRASIKKVWNDSFGEQTQLKDVEEKIADLIVRLDHQEPAVRDGAEKLLKRMGHLAIGPADRASHDDGETPEVRQRAGAVLERLKSAARAPTPPAEDFIAGAGPGTPEVHIEFQGGR